MIQTRRIPPSKPRIPRIPEAQKLMWNPWNPWNPWWNPCYPQPPVIVTLYAAGAASLIPPQRGPFLASRLNEMLWAAWIWLEGVPKDANEEC